MAEYLEQEKTKKRFTNLQHALQQFPFIAILRGILPSEAKEAAEILYNAGFRIIEVPLNSPNPFTSIALMAREVGNRAIIGAGTVVTTEQVAQVKQAGGELIVSPNCDTKIITATKQAQLLSLPGVATPSEAFAALDAGADALKIFPAEGIPPKIVKALTTVLPPTALLIPVGGISAENWHQYQAVGASGFGTGSSLYRKGLSMKELKINAERFHRSWLEFTQNTSLVS